MVRHAVHSWTLVGIVRAFLSLTFAYFLLWGSAFAFCVSKFLNFLGFFLPCPCSGFLGYKNSNFCLYKLLFYFPIRKIYAVLNLVGRRFPFGSIWFRDGECNLNGNGGVEDLLELEGGRCSNSFSGFRMQSLVDKESECDNKGKKIVNQKQKSGARRRRRAGFGYGKPPSALPYNGGEMRSKTSGNCGLVNEIEDAFHDDKDAQTSTGVSERAWHGFQLSGSFEEDDRVEKVSSSLKRSASNSQEKVGTSANEVDRIRILEKAFQEVKAAHDVLFLELDKERAAAATAADEAMAMIVRLQEDKASIEMEARQYQRMIEEKFAYDEEEMSILQEILVRKEKENHLLEKEVEAYRQMNVLRDEDSRPMLQQLNSGSSFDKKELGKDASGFQYHDTFSDCKHTYTSPVGKRIALMDWGVDSDLFPSSESAQISGASSDRSSFSYSDHGTPVKHVVDEGKVYAQNENNLSCQKMPTKAVQGIEKSPLSGDGQVKDEEIGDHSCSKLQSCTLEMEPTIYDVHVVDEQTEFHKEKNVREGGPCTSITSDNKSFPSDLGSNSSSRVYNERLRIDIEMELLSERLRKVKEQKERLIFSADQKEMVSAQLKLMEDIMNQLQKLQLLREPIRHGSLPSSSKGSSNKRHCRSLSHDSA